MPIPAVKGLADPNVPDGSPTPPQRVHWQNTFVSITGSNGQGEEIPLTGLVSKDWPTIVMQPGATGLDTPPWELHSEDSPNLDGGMFRGARTTQREIMIPVFIYGIDRKTVIDLKRKLIAALNPRNGYCLLKFMESDGQARYLTCYYKAGMEGNESEDTAGFKWVKYGIQMTAFDPWYYADTLQVAEWTFGTGVPFFGATKFLPFSMTVGLPQTNALPVVNPGDIEAWPVWEIAGPVNSFMLTNAAGESFGIPAQQSGGAAVPTGRKLTIDTRPGFKTLMDDRGTNYYGLLGDNPQLWNVPAGRSTIEVDLVSGGGTADVRMTLTPRYDSY